MNRGPMDQLRYNEAQFKASHNSYASKFSLGTQLEWNKDEPAKFGCRGLELDIAQSDSLDQFSVSHSLGFKESETQLRDHLAYLQKWSKHNPNHDVVTVTIDIKRSRDRNSFPEIFDAYISNYFDSNFIFKPGKLLVGGCGLVKSANEVGWPTLGEMKGKFIFVLSGAWFGDGEKTKVRYSQTDIGERLCFSDRNINAGTTTISVARGNRIFLNFAMGGAHHFLENELIDGAFTSLSANRMFGFISGTMGFVSRGYGLNKKASWDVGKQLGVNVLATDAVEDKRWAKVGREPYRKRTFWAL